MLIVQCEICNKTEEVRASRGKKYKTCSYSCSAIRRTIQRENNATCTQCNKDFFLKVYKLNKGKLGTFCSANCSSEYIAEYYKGKNNPNYRAKMYDDDGYLLDHIPKVGRVKVHKYVTLQYLGIAYIPKGYHIHHRDCNIHNNDIENLAILTVSDHMWIHKQFGSATLWAFYHNKISLELLVSWSNDKHKANKILTTNLKNQIGVFKPRELSGTP